MIWPFARKRRDTAATTCADAGRKGALTAHENHRAKVRQTAVDLAHAMGRPDLAEPLISQDAIKKEISND